MLYEEKEKYKSPETCACSPFFTSSKTIFSMIAILLFTLRSWSMFYLTRLAKTGVYSLILICFSLSAFACVIFFRAGSPPT